MNDSVSEPDLRMSISAVERDTGVTKDTLRVWERRYGFPDPERDETGERLYSLEQLEKLRLIRRLLDAGYRPGKVVTQPMESLRALAEQIVPKKTDGFVDLATKQAISTLFDLVKRRDSDALRAEMAQCILRQGVDRFVTQHAAPLTRAVGDAWARGEIGVLEEHLYAESLQVVLRSAIERIAPGLGSPTVILTTLPGEQHGLGLLMAEAILALEGCYCVSLGLQTPIGEIVRAAELREAGIVGISCSCHMNPNQVLEGVTDLRRLLPTEVELWIGGDAQIVARRCPPGVRVMASLPPISDVIAEWRRRQRQHTTTKP